jgi:RNA polymerase sigma factor (TIGR02999 family)
LRAPGLSSAADALEGTNTFFSAIYDDLRQRARRLYRKERANLSTTALVHETYLKLAAAELRPQDQSHFLALAARAMRQILLNAARDVNALKRGRDLGRETLDSALVAATGSEASQLIELDQALTRLAKENTRLAEVVELHFFSGLTFAQIALALGVTERTIQRDWREARAILGSGLGACA